MQIQLNSKDNNPWVNQVLVIACVRLGMKTVQQEFLPVIRYFFDCKLNAGILGGRPGEAYYLIGIQDTYLIFLDPHNTQRAVPAGVENIRKEHTTYHES